MSQTFTVWSGGGAGGSIQTGDPFRHIEGEIVRQGRNVLAYLGDHLPLGGDASTGYLTGAATWEAVNAGHAFTLDGDNLGGMTIDVVFTTWTQNAAQAVQARLRNVTDGSDAALSASHAGTTPTTETVTATLASGAKSYRLEVLGGASYLVFCVAYLRVRKVPA